MAALKKLPWTLKRRMSNPLTLEGGRGAEKEEGIPDSTGENESEASTGVGSSGFDMEKDACISLEGRRIPKS